jgi:hypothetical protein
MRRTMQFIWAVAQPPSSTRHPRWFRHLPKPLHVEPQLPSKRHCVPAAKASQSSPQGPHDYRCPARRGTVHIIFPGLHSRLSSTMKYSEHVLSLRLSDVSNVWKFSSYQCLQPPALDFVDEPRANIGLESPFADVLRPFALVFCVFMWAGVPYEGQESQKGMALQDIHFLLRV